MSVCLKFKIKKEFAYQHTVWNYNKAIFSHFRHALSNANFDEWFTSDDVNETCARWANKFPNTAKAHVPNKVVIIRPNDSPWYTNELRKMVKKRMRRSFHKYKKPKSKTDWERYTNTRNEYPNWCNKVESQYKKSLTDTLATNTKSKTWWSTVKWLLAECKWKTK